MGFLAIPSLYAVFPEMAKVGKMWGSRLFRGQEDALVMGGSPGGAGYSCSGGSQAGR